MRLLLNNQEKGINSMSDRISNLKMEVEGIYIYKSDHMVIDLSTIIDNITSDLKIDNKRLNDTLKTTSKHNKELQYLISDNAKLIKDNEELKADNKELGHALNKAKCGGINS